MRLNLILAISLCAGFVTGCSTITAHNHCANPSVALDQTWFTNHFRVWTNSSSLPVLVYDGGTINEPLKVTQPAILILHELPGMTPQCLRFATNLSAQGYTVYLPLMFGLPNVPSSAFGNIRKIAWLTVSPQWHLYRKNSTSPIIRDLRKVTRDISKEHGGKPI